MTFNDTKFEHISYSTASSQRHNTKYTAPDGSTIENSPNVRDLGINLSNDCTFSFHINKIAKKARCQSGWILRTFKTRDQSPMLTIFKSLVIPLLEYCCQLWNPWKPGEKVVLEAVQRAFTAKINNLKQFNYWERLQILKLYSLERRRERYAILYVWKVMMGLVTNNVNLQFTDHQRLGHQCVVKRVNFRSLASIQTIKANTFAIRGALLFNALPSALRNPNEVPLENFEARLDCFLS